jgi:hypothetical protein
MVGPARTFREARRGFARTAAGYGPDMPDEPDRPDETVEEQVGQEKQDQVLQREGLEEELMQQDRSDEAQNIAEVETGEENL